MMMMMWKNEDDDDSFFAMKYISCGARVHGKIQAQSVWMRIVSVIGETKIDHDSIYTF